MATTEKDDDDEEDTEDSGLGSGAGVAKNLSLRVGGISTLFFVIMPLSPAKSSRAAKD